MRTTAWLVGSGVLLAAAAVGVVHLLQEPRKPREVPVTRREVPSARVSGGDVRDMLQLRTAERVNPVSVAQRLSGEPLSARSIEGVLGFAPFLDSAPSAVSGDVALGAAIRELGSSLPLACLADDRHPAKGDAGAGADLAAMDLSVMPGGIGMVAAGAPPPAASDDQPAGDPLQEFRSAAASGALEGNPVAALVREL